MGSVVQIILVLSIFLFVNFLFSSNGLATFSCSMDVACSDVNVFEISSVVNAHSQLPGQPGDYPLKVCCSGVPSLSNSCTGNSVEVLGLSSKTNAHVEKNTFTNYLYSACLSASSDYVLDCGYAADCSSLGKSYVCLAGISKDTNAHVERCDLGYYPLKTCCKVQPFYDFSLDLPVKITAIVGEQFELKIVINNAGFLPDSYSVSIAASPANLFEISNTGVTTPVIQSDQATTVLTLVRPLTDTGDYIIVTVTSVNSPTLTKTVNIPVKIAKYSLPEFGFAGLLQIIVGATIVYTILKIRKW